MFKGPLIIKVIVASLVLYILYRITKHYHHKHNNIKYKTILKTETLFDEDYVSVVNRSDIFKPNVNFTISWKMRIANIPPNFLWKSSYKQSKPIILNGGCPDIYYKPDKNVIIIKYQMMDNKLNTVYKDLVIKNIPLQRWNNFVIILESRKVNIYMNNELQYSYHLPTVPMEPTGQFKMGSVNNNFLGKINNVVYHNYSLNMNEVKSIDN
jgi:hypothetical protein